MNPSDVSFLLTHIVQKTNAAIARHSRPGGNRAALRRLQAIRHAVDRPDMADADEIMEWGRKYGKPDWIVFAQYVEDMQQAEIDHTRRQIDDTITKLDAADAEDSGDDTTGVIGSPRAEASSSSDPVLSAHVSYSHVSEDKYRQGHVPAVGITYGYGPRAGKNSRAMCVVLGKRWQVVTHPGDSKYPLIPGSLSQYVTGRYCTHLTAKPIGDPMEDNDFYAARFLIPRDITGLYTTTYRIDGVIIGYHTWRLVKSPKSGGIYAEHVSGTAEWFEPK